MKLTPEAKDSLRELLLNSLIADGTAKQTGKRSFFMGKRIDWELPRNLGSTLPRPSHFRVEPKTKYARRERRLRLAGRCPACGKPCAPYKACDDHRFSKQISGSLSTLIREGKITRDAEGVYRPIL